MFKFDFPSFAIGLLVGWLIAFMLYRQRAGLQRLAANGRERLVQFSNSLTANIESRYLAALRTHLDQLILTKSQATFDQLYVMQRFAAPPARARPARRRRPPRGARPIAG